MPHRGGATDPDELRAAADGAACVHLPAAELLRLPRAGSRPRRRGERRRGAGDRARRPGVARRARGARRLRLRHRHRRGPGRRQPAGVRRPALRVPGREGGVHAAAARADHRRDDRRERRTRIRADAADPGAAHPPREGDVEHHHEPDAARARRAGRTSPGWGRRGCARWGRPAPPWRATRRSGWRAAGFELRVSGAGNVQGVCRPRRTERARGRDARPASAASTPATRSAATTRGWTTRCSSRSPRSRTVEEIDRLVDVLTEVAA